jgi:transposase
MSYWSGAPESRDQLVLFPRRLDEVIESDHPVRLLDEILGSLDWSAFEVAYDGKRGQPPIHPRVLASVTLYGLLTRIRSSRMLEDALTVRLDFRWLAEGRSIDHTTLSEFRRQQGEALKGLFVQVGMVAREMGLLPLERLAYDGTRIRANNSRQRARTPEELQKWRVELSQKYKELEDRLAEADSHEQVDSGVDLPAELKDTRRRLRRIDAALAELKRVEEAGETVPQRIPTTDPQSRVTPNKDGGFAANYTPLATVDAEQGFIVASDVIAMTDEEHFLVDQIEQVQQGFGLESPPAEMLADGLMATGANLRGMEELGVILYSPVKSLSADQNPAVRSDSTKPVPEDQ